MDSLVLELQREAMDSSVPIADLLRKAKTVAVKLDIKEFQDWIEKESNGYSKAEDLPDYRKIIGEGKALNPYHGWQPIVFSRSKIAEYFNTCYIFQPVSTIESSLKSESTFFTLNYSPEAEKNLQNATTGPGLEITRHIDPSQMVGIIERVRNIIHDWTLKLEKDGILGEGMTFSKEEKKLASNKNYTINIGNVTSAQFQQDSPGSTQSMTINEFDIDKVKEFVELFESKIDEVKFKQDELDEIKAEIAGIKSQFEVKKPNKNMVLGALTSIRDKLTIHGATEAGKFLLGEIGKLFI